MNNPIRVEVIPDRIGRFTDIEPFIVGLGTHHRPTEDMLAQRIMRKVGRYLITPDTPIHVDLRRGRFTLRGGRSGGGKIQVVDEP